MAAGVRVQLREGSDVVALGSCRAEGGETRPIQKRDDRVIDPREHRLSEPHVGPLMALISKWRSTGLDVPSVDPADGGICAKALFLLESPGPRAVGSTFISRDNDDPSARNMRRELDEAGFTRADTLLWNVVPYYVATVERNRNASLAQIRRAVSCTQAFINLLPDLKAVVFCGRRAQAAAGLLNFNAARFYTFHTGAMSYNRLRCREDIRKTFSAVHARISD